MTRLFILPLALIFLIPLMFLGCETREQEETMGPQTEEQVQPQERAVPQEGTRSQNQATPEGETPPRSPFGEEPKEIERPGEQARTGQMEEDRTFTTGRGMNGEKPEAAEKHDAETMSLMGAGGMATIKSPGEMEDKINELRSPEMQKFLDETTDLRKSIIERRYQYFEALRNPATPPETTRRLYSDLRTLTNKLYEQAPQGWEGG